MLGYKHDAADIFEACFGRKWEDIVLGDLAPEEVLRLAVLWNVVDFLCGLSYRDRFIVELLLIGLGINRVSQLVELVEKVLAFILQLDSARGEELVAMFVDQMFEVIPKGIKHNIVLQ